MTQNVRLQNLRDFTVQIRNAKDEIVGTGIAVSTDGKIVTCAHVVEAAGVDPKNANGAQVGVYFPQARVGEEELRYAIVSKYFDDFEDDIVLLQLTEGMPSLISEEAAVIGSTGELRNREFESFGYRSFGQHSIGEDIEGAPAYGKIIGEVKLKRGKNYAKEPLLLESNQLNAGMSGAPVLDVEDNLVVGIVSHVYDPDSTGRDRDTAFGVDARVLPLPPFDLPFRKTPLPKLPAPSPRTDEETQKQVIQVAESNTEKRSVDEKHFWKNAPTVLDEWTGREELLQKITDDWNNPDKHIVGLIGFGGEGKSSLARKWVDLLLIDSSQPQPSGVFWWGFYESRSVDEFFEAALKYFGVDASRYQSSSQRAEILGVLLKTGRFLFILDGLEVLQYEKGKDYGSLQNKDLRRLITYFGNPENESFCLITSRTPLVDLLGYTSYSPRPVDHLSIDDGRALLRKLSVNGSDEQLNQLVKDWDGHALTLSLLAGLLVDQFGGDIQHIPDLPAPTADEPRYERVQRVLRRYDENLGEAEHAFLKLFSVFRLPVDEKSFSKVFRKKWGENAINEPLVSLSEPEFYRLIGRLVDRRIIRGEFVKDSFIFTAHPLIRNHYFALFIKGDPNQGKVAHSQIKDYYLSIAGDTPQFPTLDDLKPLIEVVHHACRGEAYDEAFNGVYWERIRQSNRAVIVHQLGAYNTNLSILQEFFPNGDTTKEPQIPNVGDKRWILSAIGLCLMMGLGRLREAASFFVRIITDDIKDERWVHASQLNLNLAELYILLGALKQSRECAEQALILARRAGRKEEECYSLAYQAETKHFLGDLKTAGEVYAQAEKLEQEISSTKHFLYSRRGIAHADHLSRTNQQDYARRVTEANLQICEISHWADDTSCCHRVLGDLDTAIGNHTSARKSYEVALKIARNIQRRDVLIKALLARGGFFAKQMNDANASFSDLNEALGYCIESSYRIYEADVRVALGWAYLAHGEKEKAKQSAERALQMSNEMGYHWGKVDAEEVLERIESSEQASENKKTKRTTKTAKQTKKKSSRS